VDVVDPHASPEEIREEYSFELAPSIEGPYHGVVVAVNHKVYVQWMRIIYDPLPMKALFLQI
jgi:UDP-N-acetyl-D-galactosamine dehydrogenase